MNPNDLEHYEVEGTPYVYCTYPRVAHFGSLCNLPFWVTGQFGKIALNVLLNWTAKGQRYPKYVLLLPVRPTIQSVFLHRQQFSSHGSFWVKKCTKPPQNTACTVQREAPVSIGEPFSSCMPFRDNCAEGSQMTLNTKRVKVRHIRHTIDSTTSPKFQSVWLCGRSFTR